MRKLAGVGVRMMALSVMVNLAARSIGHPRWAEVIASLLLLGGVVNFGISAALDARRILRDRAEGQAALAEAAYRRALAEPVPLGLRADGSLVYGPFGFDGVISLSARQFPPPGKTLVARADLMNAAFDAARAQGRLLPMEPFDTPLELSMLSATVTTEQVGVNLPAFAERVRRLAGRLAPGHMPECDCSECD